MKPETPDTERRAERPEPDGLDEILRRIHRDAVAYDEERREPRGGTMTRNQAEPILERLANGCRVLLTEAPTQRLADDIIAAVVDGPSAVRRSCPARIAARLRPVLRGLLPTTMAAEHEGGVLASLAAGVVSEMLWPSPRLMSEEDAETIIAAERPHGVAV